MQDTLFSYTVGHGTFRKHLYADTPVYRIHTFRKIRKVPCIQLPPGATGAVWTDAERGTEFLRVFRHATLMLVTGRVDSQILELIDHPA